MIRYESKGSRKEKKKTLARKTYQGSVCDRAHTILEFPVEEVAKALVVRQVFDFDFLQVATEDLGVKSETVGS